MDFKKFKKDYEQRIVDSIKKILNEGVDVQALYDMDKDVVSIYIINDNVNEDKVRENIVIYSCLYNVQSKSLSVAGFNRRFGYDNFGISAVVNEPVIISDSFLSAVSTAIDCAQEPAEVATE